MAAAFALAGSSCTCGTDARGKQYRCSSDANCAEGFTCVGGVCQATSANGGGGAGGGTAGGASGGGGGGGGMSCPPLPTVTKKAFVTSATFTGNLNGVS